MAWQEVTTDVGAKVGSAKYSVSIKHGGARVSLPVALVSVLGWSTTTTLKLFVGGGEQSGKLRLSPDPAGKIAGHKPPHGGGGLLIRLGRWPGLAPRDVDAVAVETEFDGTALIVALPSHALNVVPSERAVTTAGNGAVKRDVTSQFFNDPKPQRAVAMASGTRK